MTTPKLPAEPGKHTPKWFRCVSAFPPRWRVSGARAGEIADCDEIVKAAIGTPGPAAGLAGFAYLWRRFGPPAFGCDAYRSLGSYVFTTPVNGVYLNAYPGVTLTFGYLATRTALTKIRQPRTRWHRRFSKWCKKNSSYDNILTAVCDKATVARAEKELGPRPAPPHRVHMNGLWKTDPGFIGKACRGLHAAVVELLRPVGVRDSLLTIKGVCDEDEDTLRYPPAKRSELAGYGVDPECMLARVANHRKNAQQ